MSKKVISIVLSAAMLVAVLCVGFGAVTAAADDTYTYYFLAPDSYIKAEANDGNTNVNSSVGAYWWQPEDQASPAWPGVEMTAAPEVGENVYKIEGVPAATGTIIFNAFIDAGNPQDPELAKIAHQTININTEGYEAGEAEYDATVETENFNGWIYVLANDEEHTTVNDFSGATTIGGNWFTLDNYKNYEKFYGSYGFAADTTETDSETTTDSEPASTEGKKYHAGDTVTVTVEAGDIKIDGAAAKLGAYNYDVNYDASVVKYVSGVDKTTGGMPLVNTAKEGVVKLATMAAMGLAEDFSGAKAPVYELTFEVTADTDDLGINGKCTSLTAVTADGSSTSTLVGVNNPDDPYTDLVIAVECPHETDTDSEPAGTDSEEPTSSKTQSKDESKNVSSKTDSKTESKNASSKTESKKATGDNASSKSTSSGKSATTSTATSTATVQTAGTFAVVSLVVILMAAAAVVLYTRKKTEE